MRLSCKYGTADNTVEDLFVEILESGQWRVFDLGIGSPGFQIFVYAIFSCQHLYMRTNCAERGLELSASEGRIQVAASEEWSITQLHVAFDAQIRSGAPTGEDVDYIVDRMGHCPASVNLSPIADLHTDLRLR